MKRMTLCKKNRINYIVLYDYFSVVMAKGGAFFWPVFPVNTNLRDIKYAFVRIE
jgi:hypothetical protein